MFNSGFIPSVIDGTEEIFNEPKNIGLPKQFSYMKYLPDVLNQGDKPICVPCSISAFLNWDLNLKDGSKIDNKIDVFEIFEKANGQSSGMSFKDALEFLIENGVGSSKGNIKIDRYAKINSHLALKYAIFLNGPCIGGLPVYDSLRDEFWKGNSSYLEGYHAVSIVGYNEEGFIIRNSWGESYGENGYEFIKNEDILKFTEIWTMIR